MDNLLLKDKIIQEVELLPSSFHEKVLEYILSLSFSGFKPEKQNDQNPPVDDLTTEELLRLSKHSESFDWLKDEEDIYTINDGEDVKW
jgi:hypothetical protein